MSIRAPASTSNFRGDRSPSEESTAFAPCCGPPLTAAFACCLPRIRVETDSPPSITGAIVRASPSRRGSPPGIGSGWLPSGAGARPRVPRIDSRYLLRRRRGFSGEPPQSEGRGERGGSRLDGDPVASLPPSLGPELLVEDLGDEAVEGHRVEAHVWSKDQPRIDDLTLSQLVHGALDLGLRIAVGAQDIEILALERDLVARGVHEGKDARHQGLVHHLVLLEEIAVGLPGAPRREDQARRDLDLAADLDGAMRLVLLRAH